MDLELHTMKARLGQNFLTNPYIASKIVEAAQIHKDDLVIEIGPGKGILTEYILKQNPARVMAIELDRRWADFLDEKFKQNPTLTVINADATRCDYSKLLTSYFKDEIADKKPATKRAIFIGNLPYCSATAIFQKIISGDFWKRAVFMFQKEVAQRLAAISSAAKNLGKVKRKDTGYLSIFTSYYSDIKVVIPCVKPGAFHPPPKVDSAVLSFEPNSNENRYPSVPFYYEEKIFFEIAGAAFSSRRKNILNSLCSANLEKRLEEILVDKKQISHLSDKKFWAQLLEEVGINPSKRAEELNPTTLIGDLKKITGKLITKIN